MSTSHQAIAERIFALIDADFASDAAFERAVGLPEKTVNNWRRGRSASYMKRLPALAEVFRVPLSDLLGQGEGSDVSELSEAEWHLVHLYRKARTLPKEQRRAMEETLAAVVNLYISGPTPVQMKKSAARAKKKRS